MGDGELWGLFKIFLGGTTCQDGALRCEFYELSIPMHDRVGKPAIDEPQHEMSCVTAEQMSKCCGRHRLTIMIMPLVRSIPLPSQLCRLQPHLLLPPDWE